MKITDLELFDIVAQEQSFIKAAHRLHFSQSALSQHIKKIETELGFPLFDRDRHHVSLTPRGKILLEAARDIRRRYNQALEDCQRQEQNARVLTISYVGSSSFSFLHNLIRNYHGLHPEAEISTRRIRPDMVAQVLEEGVCNLVFTPYDLVSPFSQFHFQPIYEDTLYAVMNVDNPLSEKNHLSFPDLVGKSVLAPSKEFCPESMLPVFERLCQERMHCRIRNGHNIDNAIVQLLSHKEDIAIMPGHTLPENPMLLARPFDSPVTILVGFAYARSPSPEELTLLSLARDLQR